MKFRRKAATGEVDGDPAEQADSAGEVDALEEDPTGPYDADELDDDDTSRLDLGSLLVPPAEGAELRVQVDEQSGAVRAVLLATDKGALELRAFAAPRGGDLWSDIRPQIAADAARRGGTATEREGRFGTELVCEVATAREDGAAATQTSRVIGINGPRWLLRATFIGEPAREDAAADDWEKTIRRIAVRRGSHAMPVGEPLPLSLPAGADPKAVTAT